MPSAGRPRACASSGPDDRGVRDRDSVRPACASSQAPARARTAASDSPPCGAAAGSVSQARGSTWRGCARSRRRSRGRPGRARRRVVPPSSRTVCRAARDGAHTHGPGGRWRQGAGGAAAALVEVVVAAEHGPAQGRGVSRRRPAAGRSRGGHGPCRRAAVGRGRAAPRRPGPARSTARPGCPGRRSGSSRAGSAGTWPAPRRWSAAARSRSPRRPGSRPAPAGGAQPLRRAGARRADGHHAGPDRDQADHEDRQVADGALVDGRRVADGGRVGRVFHERHEHRAEQGGAGQAERGAGVVRGAQAAAQQGVRGGEQPAHRDRRTGRWPGTGRPSGRRG